MLSNQAPLTPQHRRTNSTPTARDIAPKVPMTPATSSRQTGSHRRGLTLDPLMSPQLPQYQVQQDTKLVGTNLGEQHTMREAHQQTMARPGQQIQDLSFELFGIDPNDMDDTFFAMGTNTYEKLPNLREETGRYESTKYETAVPGNLLEDPFELFANTNMENTNEEIMVSSTSNMLNFNFMNTIAENTTGQYIGGFDEPPGSGSKNNSIINSSSQSNSDFDNTFKNSVASASSNDVEELKRLLGFINASEKLPEREIIQRPCTPPNQINTSYVPLTPITMPISPSSKSQRKPYSRTANSSPVRRTNNDTLRTLGAQPMKRGGSCQDSFMTPRKNDNTQAFPSPPNTAPLRCSRTFDVAPIPSPSFMSMSALNMSFPRNENDSVPLYHSPTSSHVSPAMSSFQSSPELTKLDLFPQLRDVLPKFSSSEQRPGQERIQNDVDFDNFTSLRKTDSSSRPQSPSKHLSVSSVGEVFDNSGVTAEEIASFIEGPDLENKYHCRFPECDKKFGRKENIRAHVQTHLGDRQFLCEDEGCGKRFVRQHDLKRHAKTHSGARPYECACGCAFARHDALTRHRQRGMCSGAFPNTPRKESKRGRPKKSTRPDTPERLAKAARTRQRVLEKQASAGSPSSSSDYSLPSPPADTFEDVDMRGTSPFDNLPDMDPMSYGVSPDIFSLTPPASPGYSTGEPPAKGENDFSFSFDQYKTNWSGDDFYTPGQDPLFSGVVFLQ